MNKIVSVLVAFIVTFFTFGALAYTPPPAPTNGGYVVDQAGKMTADQIQRLNQKIDTVSKSTKNQFGVLLLSDMGGENIEDVANATYKAWGVGQRGLDNGCLIVVSLKERKSRIETGKGIEGEVPDLKAKDILQQNLNPHLKKGEFYAGFDETIGALASLMESRQGQKADPAPTKSRGCDVAAVGANTMILPGVLIILTLGLLWWARAYSRHKQREEQERLEEARARRERRNAELKARLAREQREREERAAKEAAAATKATYKADPVPVVRNSVAVSIPPAPPTRPAVPRPNLAPKSVDTAAAATAAFAAAEAAQAKARREREEREEAERRRRRVEREEEDRRRRDREEEDRRSSYSSSSSSSFDWGGSSGGGSDSGGFGGFGGGDSGGGGASGDW